MNDRVRLTVLGISYNPLQTGVFALLLAEDGGPYRIPIVIGAAEAQSIAICLEGVISPRPLTHDLFCNLTRAYGLKLIEVFISGFDDGIFTAEMRFTDGEREVVLDARTSDAIAIAVRTGADIYTTTELLHRTGAIFEVRTKDSPVHADDTESDYIMSDTGGESPETLQRMLDTAIENEDYEEAARISARLRELGNHTDNN